MRGLRPRKWVEACGLFRLLACAALASLFHLQAGCISIETLVPSHGNTGDRVALRDLDGQIPLSGEIRVSFGILKTDATVLRTREQVVVPVPPGVQGTVPVTLWVNGSLASNSRTFRVDPEPITLRILAFGDSLVGPTCYHPEVLDQLLNESVGHALVINEGRYGETIQQGTERLPTVLDIHSGLGYLYLLEGANDLHDWKNTPLADMRTCLRQMIHQAEGASVRPVLLTLPPRTRQALLDDRTPPTTEQWNAALRQMAAEDNIACADLYEAFLAEPDWETLLLEDGLHMSEPGWNLAAQVLYDLFLLLLR